MAEREVPSRIVVGIDGSPAAERALDWAAGEAERRGGRLHIVRASTSPGARPIEVPPPGFDPGASLRAAEQAVLAAADRVKACRPDLQVTSEMVVETPRVALLAAAVGADLLVVGSSGLGSVGRLVVGSVSSAVAMHAPCPTVVVRGEVSDDGRVVVGIAGTDSDQAVLDAAFEAAARRGGDVVVVHAWSDVPMVAATGPGMVMPVSWSDPVAEAATVIDAVLAQRGQRDAQVTVHRRPVADRPAHALLAESEGAGLLVVGARGRGGLAHLLLGSVARAAVHHAGCPVLVVRTEPGRAGGDADRRATANAL